MKAILLYVLWVVVVGVCASVSRQLGLPLLAVLGVALSAGALVLWARQRHRARKVTPTALWISQRGMASGYHRTDKLTSDGVLAGFDHDDFTPGHRQTYEARIPGHLTERIFERLRSPRFQALSGSYSDPRMQDGFTLQIAWRLEGVERVVWLANSEHELLSPLVAEVWSYAPPSAGRTLPAFRP